MHFLHKNAKYASLIIMTVLLATCIFLKLEKTPLHFTVTRGAASLYLEEKIPPHTHLPDAVNLNTADKSQLTALPGIGEVLATRILAYREKVGTFRHPAELLGVQGIGKAKYKEIEKHITVE